MTTKNLLTISLTCLLLASCQSEKKKAPETDSQFFIPVPRIPLVKETPSAGSSNPYGVWAHSVPFYYCEVTFLQNGSFSYYSRGCTGKLYTEGKWTYGPEGDILCTSFDTYKQPEPVYTNTFITEQNEPAIKVKKSSKKTKGKIRFDIRDFELSPTYTVQNRVILPDTTSLYFDQERFRLKNGLMISLDKNYQLTEIFSYQGSEPN